MSTSAKSKPVLAATTPEPDPLPVLADVEIEGSIIGAILAGKPGAEYAFDTLTADQFYDPMYGRIFETMARLHAAGDKLMPMTVGSVMRPDPGLTEMGGSMCLITLAQSVPTDANVRTYARTIADFALRRAVAAIGKQAAQQAADTDLIGVGDLIAQLSEAVEGFRSSPDVQRYYASIGGKGMFLSSGAFVGEFSAPDYLVDGILQRGFIYSLTGATGAGKTAISLRIMAHCALGKGLGPRQCAAGRVLMLVGENADDVRMRWIALAEQMGFFTQDVEVYFVPAVFPVRQALPRLHAQAESIGDISLIVVDTSAAYFPGDDENANKQAGDHARDLRALTGLPGKPCVLVNCHPTKGARDENLLPRGGGAFVAEVDGNLTCSKKDGAVELHWQGKYRGPEFEPMSFELLTVTSDKLRDSRDRSIPTVIARPLSASEVEAKADAGDADMAKLMITMLDNPTASIATLAQEAGWTLKTGEPHKSKVVRLLEELRRAKLAEQHLRKWRLTPTGTKTAKVAA